MDLEKSWKNQFLGGGGGIFFLLTVNKKNYVENLD
jgi:hypothetical protein